MMQARHSSTRLRVTQSITVITVVAFLAAYITGMNNEAAYAGGFIPARVSEPALLDGAGLVMPVVPVWLTPLSATLLHGGWLHLIFNMLMFLFCGRQVEMVLGGRAVLILYGVGAYAAAFGQWVLGPDMIVPMIGASGAISAIIGAYALLFSNQEVKAVGPIPANVVRMLWLGAGWVFLQFLIGAVSGLGGDTMMTGGDAVAVGAHVGGFVVGMLLTRPLLAARYGKSALSAMDQN